MPYFTNFQKAFDLEGTLSLVGTINVSILVPLVITPTKDRQNIVNTLNKTIAYYQSLFKVEITFDYNIIVNFPNPTRGNERLQILIAPFGPIPPFNYLAPNYYIRSGELRTDTIKPAGAGNINISGTAPLSIFTTIFNNANIPPHNAPFRFLATVDQLSSPFSRV